MRPNGLPDILVEETIRRPAREVRAWWLDFPDEYRATDPREEPHRIRVVRRAPESLELDTYWRLAFGREIRIRETIRSSLDGNWSIDVGLPLGLAQRDDFTLSESDGVTRVRIEVRVWARSSGGALVRAAFVRWARRRYARTWREAARLCERDAPRL